MSQRSRFSPALVGRINERRVFRAIQRGGPLSRAELARRTGISPPTASKAVEALLKAGLLEESAAVGGGRGRRGREFRLAHRALMVLGLVLDADYCTLIAAGPDGRAAEAGELRFATPSTYEELIEQVVEIAPGLIEQCGAAPFGMGISVPGLIDYRRHCSVLSPNLPLTNGRCPALDLRERLGIECVLIQESHGLCLAERVYGASRDLDDFVMVDISTGVGCGVMSGGRLLRGQSGMAGELGHITVRPDGDLCGCGNAGCLETEASDRALLQRLSRRAGRMLQPDDLRQISWDIESPAVEDLDNFCRYLGIGLAAAINLFNPATLFVHGRLFGVTDGLFERVVEEVRRRALGPSIAECRIMLARATKQQGATAAILEHLTDTVAPDFVINRSVAAASGHAAVRPKNQVRLF